ncbi:MAG: SH3 domain-containing protein [Thermomicrobiales bacterium]|nr:SH3 domain-containing protein [Thermomicrobiales bacterium]
MDAGSLDCAATHGRDMWEGSAQPDADYPEWAAAKQARSRAPRLPRRSQHAKDVGMSSDPGRARPNEERTVSYQPEERYWTDYLRIALPVVGLLLLIGLLWYWASALIGDGSPAQAPTPEVAAIVTPINQATPAPPTPTAVVIAPTPGPPVAPTATAVVVAPPPTQPPAPATVAPTTAPENPCANLPVYEVGTLVMTTDQVNLRDAPTTEGNIVTELPAGAQLQVTGPFSEAGQCDWWPVTATETGQAGFVIEQYLQPVTQ